MPLYSGVTCINSTTRMGKGGCEELTSSVGAARGAVCCLACIFLLAPILLLAGIVLLATPNERKSDVADYNNMVTSFMDTRAPIIRGTSVTANGVSLTVATETVLPSGNTEGLRPDVESTHWTSGRTLLSVRSLNVDTQIQLTSQSFSTTFGVSSLTRTKTDQMTCKCGDPRKTDRYCTCHEDDMRSICQQRSFGAQYTDPAGTGCSDNTACGECRYQEAITAACFVLRYDGTREAWERSTVRTSCKYPFGADDQPFEQLGLRPLPTQVSVQIREESDPLVVLEALTEGRLNFGITEAQQKKTGMILVAIGSIGTAVMIGLIVMMCCRREHTQQVWTAAQGNKPQQSGEAYAVGQPVDNNPYPPNQDGPVGPAGGYGGYPPGVAPPLGATTGGYPTQADPAAPPPLGATPGSGGQQHYAQGADPYAYPTKH